MNSEMYYLLTYNFLCPELYVWVHFQHYKLYQCILCSKLQHKKAQYTEMLNIGPIW